MRKIPSWELLGLLTLLAIIGPIGLDMYLPAISAMPQALSTGIEQVQWTLSIYMLALGAGQLVLGPVADRWGRRPVMLVSLILFALGSAGATQVDSIGWLIGWRALQGFGGCGAGLVAFAMVRDLYNPAQRGQVYSLINAGIGIAPALAPIFGGYLLLLGSWRLTFWALLLLALITLIACVYRVQESRPGASDTHTLTFLGGYRALCAHPGYLSYCAAGLACMSGLFTFFSLSPLLLVGVLGVSEQQFAYYFASNALVMMVTSLIAARIVSVLGNRATVLLGLLLVVVAGLLLLLFARYFEPHPLALMFPVWLASCGFALTMGAAAAGALADFGHIAGSATALMSCVRLGGAALVGTLAVWWDSESVTSLAWVLVLSGALSAIAVWRCCVASTGE